MKRKRDAKGRYLPSVPTPAPHYLATGDLFLRGATICSLCGSLVVNEDTHTAYHEEEK